MLTEQCVCECVYVCVYVLVTQLCPTVCYSVNYSLLPGSSVHEILQARILEWLSMLFSRDIPHLLPSNSA